MREYFEDIEKTPPPWMDGSGPSPSIVLSTRARLARNVRTFPFPHRASAVELGTVLGDAKRRLVRVPIFADGEIIELEELDPLYRRLLAETGLATAELIQDPQKRAVAVSRDRSHSVQVNEENHLHVVAYRSGFDPHGALSAALGLDAGLEAEIETAFDAEFGYLTANPAGVGTGLRLSAHVHLPGLVFAGEIEKVCNALNQLQFKVEGLYGKGRSVRGSIFQISNLVTLGQSEEELAGDFEFHVGRLILHERTARQQLLYRDRLGTEDMAQRNLAVLRVARLVSAQEAVDRLSHVRMGADLGLLPELDPATLNESLCRCQPAHLEVGAGRPLVQREITAARADFLRNLLGGA